MSEFLDAFLERVKKKFEFDCRITVGGVESYAWSNLLKHVDRTLDAVKEQLLNAPAPSEEVLVGLVCECLNLRVKYEGVLQRMREAKEGT